MYLEVAVALVVLYIIYFVSCHIFQSHRLPPGPFPLPIIGNVLSVDDTKPHISFRDMSKNYGEIFRLQLGVQRVVVINSGALAREALLRRNIAFAGRPASIAASLFSGGCKDIVFQTYNPIWRIQHRIAKSGIRACENKINSIEECVYKEIAELTKRFDAHGKQAFDPRPDTFNAIVNCLGSLVFGSRYEKGHPELQTLKDIINCFRENLGAANFLDAFPVLAYFPFKSLMEVKKGAVIKEEFFNRKISEHRATFKEGKIRDLVDAMIAASSEEVNMDENGNSISDDRIALVTADAFIAGTETPTSGLLWVFSVLAQYPDVQRKLQRELDDVIGRDRLPVMQDKLRLPYVEAVIAEVMRYVSFMPMAVPHCTTTEVTVGGFVIPADTVVYFNTWAIHHDPQDFPDPMEVSSQQKRRVEWNILSYPILSYLVLSYPILAHHTIPYHTIPYYTIPYHIIP